MRKISFNYYTTNVYVFTRKQIKRIFNELYGVNAMASNNIVKYNYEKLAITCDFIKEMATGEKLTLDSYVEVFDKSNNDVSNIMIDDEFKKVEDAKIIFKIQEGGDYAYSPYTIKVKVVTNLGNQYQMNLNLEITKEN